MRFTTPCAAATASALFVIWAPLAGAGEIKQYQAKPVEQYTAKSVEQYGGRNDFTPPAGWTLSEQNDTSTVYKRGPCGFAFGTLRPMDGPFPAAAEAYLDSAVKRNADRGEVIEKMTASTRLGNTGIITRAFTATVNGTPTWNIRIVGPQAGAMRPFYLRCTDAEAFKESWPVVGQSIVDYLGGGGAGAGSGARQSQGGGIHLFTPEERQAMMRNDTAAGRTRDSMLSGRDSGGGEAQGGGGARLFLGTWYGANVMGQIDIHPDGTYSSPNGARGQWQPTGDRSLVFTSGPLTAWNGGRASVSDKNALEFKWTTPQGQKQYFVYIRR